MIRGEERNDVMPLCPHCKAEVSRIGYQTIESTLGKRFIYFCLACRACLGVSHRKGFWMG